MKRQEEIKLEEERLKRETEIIEEERNQADLQMLTSMPTMASITSLTSTMTTGKTGTTAMSLVARTKEIRVLYVEL